jgi:GDP-fucose protein O-fucosyltransferase
MRDRARRKNPQSHGEFDTFHIRRGDFQYKNTRIEAEEIYNNVKDVLQEGSTVYIATDERDKAFFAPLTKHYDVYFMDNFMPQLKGVNKNMFGKTDCIVAFVALRMVLVLHSQSISMVLCAWYSYFTHIPFRCAV